MGGLEVRLGLVGFRHAGHRQLVQRSSKGGPDKGRTLAGASGSGAFEIPSQRLVDLNYELLGHVQSIRFVYLSVEAGKAGERESTKDPPGRGGALGWAL